MAEVTEIKNLDSVIDIDLSSTAKRRIRIDGDDSRILTINLSDLNVMSRVQEVYPKMMEMAQKASYEQVTGELGEDEENQEEQIEKLTKMLDEIDSDMRGFTDYIFNADVCSVAAPEGTMYDLFNGKFRFEIIIETLLSLYTDNVNLEFRNLAARVNKHTHKYTKKK